MPCIKSSMYKDSLVSLGFLNDYMSGIPYPLPLAYSTYLDSLLDNYMNVQ
jgi:hypothetical protein